MSSTPSLDDEEEEEVQLYTFEEAMTETGFGLFNIILLLVGILCTSSLIFQTLAMSFIMPSAECDLALNVQKKGILISVVFIGMIISAIPWGFLADTHGRKTVLVSGFLIDGLIVMCASVCRKYVFLVVEMFMVGLAISGPFDCFLIYIAEMNSERVRSRVLLVVGFCLILATFLMTGLASYILPQTWSLTFLYAKFSSWQIFMMVTAVPSFLAGVCFLFFPESPKFLMAVGFDDKALEILKTIYAINKCKSRRTFKVKYLKEYTVRSQRASVYSRSLVHAYELMLSFFTRELAFLALKIFFVAFSIVTCLDTIRLWLPHLFATLVEFKAKRAGKNLSWCNIIDYIVIDSELDQKLCMVYINPHSYVNNFFIGGASLIGFFLALIVINRVGPQIILSISLIIIALASFALYWAETEKGIISLSSIFIAAGSLSKIMVIYMALILFPTSMRAVIIAFTMTSARIGCVLGNFMFPLMLKIDCMMPLLWWALVSLIACGVSVHLPNPIIL